MRMAELSNRSGVAIPTIKFYLREGLLPAGQRTSPNQSTYDGSHLERLRLIRALTDVGGLSVGATRDVLGAIDADIPLDWAFGIAQRAATPLGHEVTPVATEASMVIDELIASRGWRVVPDNPGRRMAARVIESYRAVGQVELTASLSAYADAAAIVAEADLASVSERPDRALMTETVVVGTVLGDALFAGLRRIAQEHVSHRRYPARIPISEQTEASQ